jgi:RNA recognition motif-containing protein
MNIFIAGLNYSISDSELSELFTQYGEVTSARVIKDRQSGRSKGYGFVEMSDDEAAEKAIKELNGTEVKERPIVVTVARPKTDEPRRNNYDRR